MLGFVPIGGLTQNRALIDVIGDLGLTASLQLCLDSGDSRSYDGSSQTWTDQSGGSYSFFRGTGSGSEGSDPTFNGNAGRQSANEFFSFDGGDCFTLNQANPTWVTNLHKNGNTWSSIGWWFIPALAPTTGAFWGDNLINGSAVGLSLHQRSTNALRSLNSNGTSGFFVDSSITIGSTGWHFLGAAGTSASSGTVVHVIDGSSSSGTFQVFTPSAAAATATLQIGQGGNSVVANFPPSGTQLSMAAMWQGTVLTAAQMISIYTATRQRYGV